MAKFYDVNPAATKNVDLKDYQTGSTNLPNKENNGEITNLPKPVRPHTT